MSVDNVQDIDPIAKYIAAGGQTAFIYPFPIFAAADLVVYDDDTVQSLGTHYTVSGAGNDNGGTVTFLTGRTAGHKITIYRDIAIARTTDFSQNGPRRSADMNDELDRMTMWMQQLERNLGRAVRMSLRNPQASSALELTPTSAWASRYLFVNSSGALEPAAAIALTTLTQSIIGQLLNPQTAAEASAAVTPTNYAYLPGDVRRYGAVGDGTTDDTAAIQRAINAVGVAGEVIFPATGIYLCAGSLTGLNFQTWRGHSYELGAGGSQAAIKCSKTSGTFITTGSNQKFENIRFLGVVTYTDATGATAGSTALCMKLTDSVTFRDCVFQLQFRCVETTGFSANYIRIYSGEVVRCAQFLNIVDGDAFNVQIDGTVFRLCSTFSASSATPKKYIHNLKVQGGSFESWVAMFNSIRTASFFGTYFESDIVGGIGFNSDGSFIDKDTSISLFGCFVFLNNLDRFVNYSGLNGCTFVSIGNLVAGSVNSGQNQYYFVPQNAGTGRTVMLGDYLDDRGVGTFHGTYVSDTSKVRNQLIVWPRGTTADHANVGQTWVDGNVVSNSIINGSATYDPANLADGAGVTTTVTATGAAAGDFAVASFSNDLQGITLTAWVSATDTVSVRFQNESGGAIDLASGTLRVRVTKQ